MSPLPLGERDHEPYEALDQWFERCKEEGRAFLAEAITARVGMGAILLMVDEDGGMAYCLLAETDEHGNNPDEQAVEERATEIVSYALERLLTDEAAAGHTSNIDGSNEQPLS